MAQKTEMKVFVLFLMMFFISGCSKEKVVETKTEAPKEAVQEKAPMKEMEKDSPTAITPEEAEFNASGRAKAYDDEEIENQKRQEANRSETVMWQFFEDEKAGFSLNSPHNIALTEDVTINDPNVMRLTVRIEKISETERPGFDRESAEANIVALNKGTFGEDFDQSIEISQKVRRLNGAYAQESLVLSRFEVCNVVFDRKLVFYRNDYQITLTLNGPRISIINEMNNYFKMDEENCGNEKIWDFDKQANFYKKLQNEEGSPSAQEWFDLFDKIIGTIDLN